LIEFYLTKLVSLNPLIKSIFHLKINISFSWWFEI